MLSQSSEEKKEASEEEQVEMHYSKHKKCVYWTYLFVAFCALAAQIYLVMTIWTQMYTFSTSDNYYYANQVTVQWQTGFIDDIIVTSSPTCPTSYSHGFSFQWPGTGFGCFCQMSQNTSFVLEGLCEPALIQENCTNIVSEDPRTAHYWSNNSNICIRRSSVSFATEKKYDQTNKLCGSSSSLVVVDKSEACPLVNLTQIIPTLEDHYRVVLDDDQVLSTLYVTYNATSPYSFYSYPLSKMVVSEHEFCLIDDDSGLSPDHSEFILLNSERGCEETGNVTQLKQILQTEFYANNQNLNDLTTSISGFPKPSHWKYKLGFASLPGWTYQCRHLYDGKFAMDRALYILNFENYDSYNAVAITQIIALVIVGVEIFILFIRRACRKEVYPVGFRQTYLPCEFCKAITRYLVDFTAKVVLLGLTIFVAWKSFQYWNWFKSAINEKCSDDNPELNAFVINPYAQLYEKSLIYSVAHLTVLVILIIVDIVHLCYVYRYQLSYYLVESAYKDLVKDDTQRYNFIDKDLDNKGLDVENIDGLDNAGDSKTEEFRVTMNLFSNDEKDLDIVSKPIKNNKKNRKKKFNMKEEKEERQPQANILKIEDDFNPYTFEEPTLIGMNSRDALNQGKSSPPKFQDIDEEAIVRGRRKGKGRGRKF